MKSNNTRTKRFSIFLLVCVVSIGLGWLWWSDGIAPVDPANNESVAFVINRGEGVKNIASRLAQEHLIRSPTSFYILVKILGIERQLQAGDYRLSRTMDARAVALELTRGIVDVWVTTLEGWRVEEVATKIAKELDIPEGEFLKHAEEGYVFPDTYLIPQDASPAAVVRMMRDNFDRRVTEDLRQAAEKTDVPFKDVMTLASIVEREGISADDRPVIAGILLKRLRAGWPLQADATVQYALGYDPGEKTWWRKSLTAEDKNIDSPYNTYRNTGLPPSPISNPGLASIRAVIYPVETGYWYYLHDPQGGVHYAETIEEHNANIATYLR